MSILDKYIKERILLIKKNKLINKLITHTNNKDIDNRKYKKQLKKVDHKVSEKTKNMLIKNKMKYNNYRKRNKNSKNKEKTKNKHWILLKNNYSTRKHNKIYRINYSKLKKQMKI